MGIGINLGMLRSPKEHSGNVAACSLCMSCQEVCPVKVDLGQQIYRWRQELQSLGTANPAKKALSDGMSLVYGHPFLYKAATAPFRPFHSIIKDLEK